MVVALIFSISANQQALDTDSWVKTSDGVLEDKAVQVELAHYISDELFDSIEIDGVTRADLPAGLRKLHDISPEGLRRGASAEVLKALNASKFKQIWSESNRTAHEALMRDLDSSQNLAAEDEKVTLDLNPIVTNMSTRLGFDDSVTARIPPDAARLTVAESDQVGTARDVVRIARVMPWVLSVLVILFFTAAILLAGSYRRQVVLVSGLGLNVAGAIALLLRSAVELSVVGRLAAEDSVRPAAKAAWSIGTSQLVTFSIWTMAIGAVVMLGAGLAALRSPRSQPQDGFEY